MANLFSIVEKPHNYVFWGRLNPPESPWKGLQVTNFDQCLHIVVVIWKCTDFYRGIFDWLGGGVRGGGYVGELSMEEIVKREENLHEGDAEFPSIIKKNINVEKFFHLKVRSSIKT